jgi:hypothetical protein
MKFRTFNIVDDFNREVLGLSFSQLYSGSMFSGMWGTGGYMSGASSASAAPGGTYVEQVVPRGYSGAKAGRK